MALFFLWIAWSGMNGFIAKAWWFSLLLSPLLVFLYLVATPSESMSGFNRQSPRMPPPVRWPDESRPVSWAEVDRERQAAQTYGKRDGENDRTRELVKRLELSKRDHT